QKQMDAAGEMTDTETGDSSLMNPMLLAQGAAATINIAKSETLAPAQNIKEIVDQIVSHISQMSYAGKTETLVTLSHPPLLAGANVVLTSFESAKGEFNIAFENLTQEAKMFL